MPAAMAAEDTGKALPSAADVVVGELSSIAGMRQAAEQANALGRFDAVIHNVGGGYRKPKRIVTPDGLSHVFAINVRRPWNGSQAYADSKFLDVLLAFGAARHWPGVLSNAVTPGWVPTKMSGAGAPDDIALASVSDDAQAKVTGRYFRYQKLEASQSNASGTALQDALLTECARISGMELPA